MQSIFITGQYRSGTTLTEKILSCHPNIKIASQPFPHLYFKIKSNFHNKLNLKRRYPLGTLFGEQAYNSHEFTDYILKATLSKTEIDDILESMNNYFGNWTPELKKHYELFSGGSLIDIYNSMLTAYSQLFEKTPNIVGSKEILAEEYIPYFLDKNVKVIHIIRDIRDIIVSLNYGSGEYYTGKIRPILYSIRNWRKSIAFSLQHQSHPNYYVFQYENLARNPSETINNFLLNEKITPIDFDNFTLKDQYGNSWKSNSSFSKSPKIDTDSIGKYNRFLDEMTIKYIENLCTAEFNVLGYNFNNTIKTLREFDISSYKEPFEIVRDDFSSNFSSSEENIKMEKKRLTYLDPNSDIKHEELISLFIFESALNKLRLSFIPITSEDA